MWEPYNSVLMVYVPTMTCLDQMERIDRCYFSADHTIISAGLVKLSLWLMALA